MWEGQNSGKALAMACGTQDDPVSLTSPRRRKAKEGTGGEANWGRNHTLFDLWSQIRQRKTSDVLLSVWRPSCLSTGLPRGPWATKGPSESLVDFSTWPPILSSSYHWAIAPSSLRPPIRKPQAKAGDTVRMMAAPQSQEALLPPPPPPAPAHHRLPFQELLWRKGLRGHSGNLLLQVPQAGHLT